MLIKRKTSEKTTPSIIALIYDFDNTLCTKDMQEYSFIPLVGMSREAFWGEVGKLADSQKMDRILDYMGIASVFRQATWR